MTSPLWVAKSAEFTHGGWWSKAQYKQQSIDKIAGIEARGFMIGSVLDYELDVGFVPIRKAAMALTQQLGGVVISCAFVIDLADIGGMQRLKL